MNDPLNPTITVEFKTPSGWLFYIEGKATWGWAEDERPVSMHPETGVIRYESIQYPELQDVSVTLAETYKGLSQARKIEPGEQLDKIISKYWAEFEESFKAQAVEPIYKHLEP